jgi:hypothetical protein
MDKSKEPHVVQFINGLPTGPFTTGWHKGIYRLQIPISTGIFSKPISIMILFYLK